MSTHRRIDDKSAIDFRQLRHQTKNALTCILAQVSSGLASSASCRRTVEEVERRILLTAQISDALFGLTREPGPFATRLEDLCEGVIGLSSDGGQYVTFVCSIAAEPTQGQVDTVLRIAHELIENAVKHGMRARLLGRIEVIARDTAAGFVLDVRDDGSGCDRTPAQGEGLFLAKLLADSCGGAIELARFGDQTVARLIVTQSPHRPENGQPHLAEVSSIHV